MKRPPTEATLIRIFRHPRTSEALGLHRWITELPERFWAHVDAPRSKPPAREIDADLERSIARAAVALAQERYLDALALLDDLEAGVGPTQIHPVELAWSRAEVLMASGRPADAVAALDGSRSVLPRCWLATAQAEAGKIDCSDVTWAELELELVEETDTSNIWRLQVAWFAAFVGDFDRADRMFDRVMQSPVASRMATAPNGDLVGLARSAAWLAREGPMPEAGRSWGAELERRCRAQRALRSL